MQAPSPDQYHLTIKELPADERPREKLRLRGASALTSAELLAILLNSGTRGETVIEVAQRLLVEHDGLTGLVRADFEELCQTRGLGEAKVSRLLATMELARRISAAQPQDRPQIKSPEDIYLLLGSEMAVLEQEQLRVVLLDTKNRVSRIVTVYQGSVNSAQVRVAELFRDAVRATAPAIMLVHNHPSGDPEPSRADALVTRDAVQAGELLGIEVIDHIVIGDGRFQSLRRAGMGFS
ncbi:MAG: JAB domain-containing protein [Sphaerobacteraceae bacterium]|nr:MAG: JAB domain-containing protein [Sphaerobacteraceae bacterium]